MRSFPSVVLHPHLQFPSDFSKAEEKHNYGSWRNGVSSEVNVNQAWDLLCFPQQDKVKNALYSFISTKCTCLQGCICSETLTKPKKHPHEARTLNK